MSKKVENYFKEKVKEILDRVYQYEKTIIADRDSIESTRDKILKHKQGNPDGTYKDVEGDLKSFIKTHYYSFLLERSLINELERACELVTAADVLDIDLGLEGDHEKAVVNIKSNHIRTFGVNKDGVVGLLDSAAKPQIEHGINQQLSAKNLEDAYKNMQPLKEQ